MIDGELYHLIACTVITWLVMLMFHLQFKPLRFVHRQMYNWDAAIACGVSLLVAIGKEIVWDMWFGLGTPQFYDFVWGLVGAVIGPIIWLLVEVFLGVSTPLPKKKS